MSLLIDWILDLLTQFKSHECCEGLRLYLSFLYTFSFTDAFTENCIAGKWFVLFTCIHIIKLQEVDAVCILKLLNKYISTIFRKRRETLFT